MSQHNAKLPALRPVEEMEVDWEQAKRRVLAVRKDAFCDLRLSPTSRIYSICADAGDSIISHDCASEPEAWIDADKNLPAPTPSEPDTAGVAECVRVGCFHPEGTHTSVGCMSCGCSGYIATRETMPSDKAAGQGASGDDRNMKYRVYICDHPGSPMTCGGSFTAQEMAEGKARWFQDKGKGTDLLHVPVDTPFQYQSARIIAMLASLGYYLTPFEMEQVRWTANDTHSRLPSFIAQPSLPPVEGSDGLPPEAQKAFDRGMAMVGALCTPRGVEGHRDWTMSIPAEPDSDPDLVISNALHVLREQLRIALRARPTVEEVGGKDEHRDEGLIREIGEEEHALRSKLAKACAPYELSSMARTSLQRTKVLEAEVTGKDAEIARLQQEVCKERGFHNIAKMQLEDARAELATKDAEIAELRKLAANSERWRKAYQNGKQSLYAMGGEVADAAMKHLPCNEGQLDRDSRRVLVEPFCAPIRERAEKAEAELATLRVRSGGGFEEWYRKNQKYIYYSGAILRDVAQAAWDAALSTSPQAPVQVVPEIVQMAAQEIVDSGDTFSTVAQTCARFILSLLQGNQPQEVKDGK